MTPADIRGKRFDKGMGGYKTEEVHQFLEQIAGHIEQLEDEKADIIEKMEVLADKLEQYREDEESLRAALIGAQKLGNSVVRESQRKAEAIIAQAVRKTEQMVTDAQKNIDSEALALKRMQRDVAGFREKIIRLYSEHLEMIKSLPEEGDLSDMQIAQISYTPPSIDEVQQELDLPAADGTVDSQDGTLAFAVEDSPVSDDTLIAEDTGHQKHGLDRKGFGQLNQFFGEDKPIERK